MKTRILCAAAVLSLCLVALCLSCAPPFDAGFSTTAIIIGKLTKEGKAGPVNLYFSGNQRPTPIFYPQKTSSGVDATQGFTLITDSGGMAIRLGFVKPDGTGGYGSFDTEMASLPGILITSLYNQDTTTPPFTVMPVKSGDFTAIVSIDSLAPSNSNVVVEQGSLSTWSFTNVFMLAPSPLATYIASPQLIGAAVYPTTSSSDTVYLLVQSSTSLAYREVQSSIDLTGISSSYSAVYSWGPDAFSFIPGSTKRVMYFHDPVQGVSYASFASGGAWQCWKWWYDAAGVLQSARLTGVTARVDALLSTGELLSVQGGVGRVYDSNGNQETSFPLGNLQLAYEAFVNGSPRVFFSLPAFDDQSHVYFTVYSIATAGVRSLTY